MSNKHADNNDKQTQTSALQQQSDETFINELYNEVSEENQSQPSELLDQRIINAAHKAVNTPNKPKSNRNFKWYSSLATAASLTLVISLVVLQKGNILPNEQAGTPIEKGITLQKSIKPANDNEYFADQEIETEKINFQQSTNYSAVSSKMANPITNNIKASSQEKIVRAIESKKQAQLGKQKSAERMMPSPSVSRVLLAELARTPEVHEEHKVISLSIKQFQQYILSNNDLSAERQWLWALKSENDMAYMISIYQNKLQPLQYRLDKSTYKIIAISNKHNKEPSLKSKNSLEITIINR
jgi:hypothetical protein